LLEYNLFTPDIQHRFVSSEIEDEEVEEEEEQKMEGYHHDAPPPTITEEDIYGYPNLNTHQTIFPVPYQN
jgi:hypothetical protein